MRHVELSNALRAAGMEIHRGEKVRDGFLFYTIGTERSRVTWTGPPTGDGDVAFATTSEANGGIGFALRSLRLTVAYAVGEIHGWEAHVAEKHEALEQMEAATSKRACDAKKNAGVCTARDPDLGGRGIFRPRA